MRVIKSGGNFEFYSDYLEVFDKLPAGEYIVRFHEMKGFYLEEYSHIEIKEKIYGVHLNKVQKVLNSFKKFERNLGVILSGNKGIGKSLFSKLLSVEAIKNGYPLIIVDRYIPGIASFIEEIDQEVVVLFDEFDKTYKEEVAQTSMLTLFDGISQGKKMFVITCNELRNLNEYLTNRPGRFHYHFRFDYPSADQIREYLRDKIDGKFYQEIEEVVKFANKIDLNYDCLRAIAFELNTGETFKEAIQDLNIINVRDERYNIVVYFEEGYILTSKNVCLDLFDAAEVCDGTPLYDQKGRQFSYLSFKVNDCFYDVKRGGFVIEPNKFELTYDTDYCKEEVEKVKKMKPEYALLSRTRDKSIHYAV